MSVNRYIEEYKDTPKELELIASKGQRVFLGTKAAVDSAIKAGDIGNYSVVYTTDDFEADLYPDKVEVGCVNTENIPIEVPAGSIQDFAGDIAPEGYFICDGASKNTADYPRLFAVIGYKFGGSGSTFKLPDFRNKYAIGKGDRRGTSKQETDAIGKIVEGTVKSHQHSMSHTHTRGSMDITGDYRTQAQYNGDTKVPVNGAFYQSGNSSGDNQFAGSNIGPSFLVDFKASRSWSGSTSEPSSSYTGYTGGKYNYVDSIVVNKIIKY